MISKPAKQLIFDIALIRGEELFHKNAFHTYIFYFQGGNYIASVKGEDTLTAKIQEMIDTINAEGLYQQWVDEIQK